jgi:hypothetical protein
MSSLPPAGDMSPPVSPAPSSSLATISASPTQSPTPIARCGHYIFDAASTDIDSLDAELCTGCELRAAVAFTANSRTAEDPDSASEGLLTWRKARLALANFEFATEGTDGCSAGHEFTLEQQKFCRNMALGMVEGEEAEQLKAEMEADEAEERAAAAAMKEGTDSTTTTTTTTDSNAQIANINTSTTSKNTTYASNSALKGARAARDLSQQINNNKRKRSRSVTHATSADVHGDANSHEHRDEDSYRPNAAYDRDNKDGNGYSRGLWAAPLRTSWLNTSGKGIDADKWEREANDSYEPRRTRSQAKLQEG